MKKIKIVLVSFIAAFSLLAATEVKAQDVNFSLFEQELSPYGQWVMHPRFGEVWVYNEPGFRPYYSNGHWDYTDYGWSWASDYEWGNITFHYGRWENDSYYGWMWIPGYEWAPAWVSWSQYDNYYGWAPLGYGMGINIGFNDISYNNWIFIPRNNIYDHDLYRYYISPERNYGFRNAMLINNYYRNNNRGFMRGPDRDEAQRFTNNRIAERRIEDRERQGRIFGGNRFNNAVVNNNQQRNNNNRSNDVAYNNLQRQATPRANENRNFNNAAPQQNTNNRGWNNAARQNNYPAQPQVQQPVRQQQQPQVQQPVRQQPQPRFEQPVRQQPQPQVQQPVRQQPQPRFEQPVRQQPQQAQVQFSGATRQAEYRNTNNANQQKGNNGGQSNNNQWQGRRN